MPDSLVYLFAACICYVFGVFFIAKTHSTGKSKDLLLLTIIGIIVPPSAIIATGKVLFMIVRRKPIEVQPHDDLEEAEAVLEEYRRKLFHPREEHLPLSTAWTAAYQNTFEHGTDKILKLARRMKMAA